MNFQPLEVVGIKLVDNVSSTFFFLLKMARARRFGFANPCLWPSF
jgi:hypothetical protein